MMRRAPVVPGAPEVAASGRRFMRPGPTNGPDRRPNTQSDEHEPFFGMPRLAILGCWNTE